MNVGAENKLEMIKKLILETAKKYDIQIAHMYLFGSRARGNYKKLRGESRRIYSVDESGLIQNEGWLGGGMGEAKIYKAKSPGLLMTP